MTLLYIYRGSDYIYDIIFENYGSIADITSYEDNGSISASGTYENFGYVTPPNGPWAPSQYYNYGSVVDVADYEDYGSITGTVVYGSRTGQGDGTSSDYGSILDGLSANVEFIGSLKETRRSSEVGSGSLSALSGSAVAFGANPAEDTLLGTFSGVLVEKKVASEVGLGTISISGADLDAKVSSNVGLGTINVSGLGVDNRRSVEVGFGTLSALSGSAVAFGANPAEDTLLGTFSGVLVEKKVASEVGLGTISISGADLDAKVSSNVGLGTLSGLSGSAESKTISYNQSSVAINNDYGSILSPVTDFADYGNLGTVVEVNDFGALAISSSAPFGLFNISVDKVEKKSYNYNQFSIVFYDGTEDYGFIADATSYENNGSIVDLGPYEDFGTIAGLRNETVYPYGTINLSGIAGEDFIGAKIHEGSGTINLSGSLVENRRSVEVGSGSLSALSGSAVAFGANPAEDTLLGTFSGVLVEKKVASEVGLGTISISGSVTDFFIESQRHSGFGTIDASGLLVERRSFSYISSPYDDYGFIINATDYNENYGSIVDPISYVDYGALLGAYTNIDISGSASAEVFVANPPEDTVLGTFSGTKVEKAVAVEVGSGTINFSGDAITSREGEIIEIGSGTINVSGSLVENRRSVEVGFGTFSALSGSAVVFGANPPEDTALGSFSGVLVEKKVASEVGLGTIRISGSVGDVRVTSNIGLGTINVSGLGVDNRRSVEVGFGTLSGLSGSAESKTISYNQSSVATDNDYGSILTPITDFADYGNLGSVLEVSDFGILPTTPKTPFGLFEILVDKVEKKSYNYNQFSIVFYDGTEDYGFIADATSYENNGSIVDLGPYEDFGTIAGLRNETVYPYGTINLSGIAGEDFIGAKIHEGSGTINLSGSLVEKRRSVEVGFGTFSALSGSAVAFGANPPEDTLLGSFSGINIEKISYNYNEYSSVPGQILEYVSPYGSINDIVTENENYGSINNTPTLFDNYGSINYGATYPFGTITISGSVEETFLASKIHQASGTINASGALIENRSFSYISSPYDDYGFIINATDYNENYGSIVDPISYVDYGALLGAYTNIDISGSASAEVFVANPPEDTVLGTFSGTKVEKAVAVEVGSGTINFSGDAITSREGEIVLVTSGTINVSGSLVENRRSVEIGSGTLSALSGSAVAFGANPAEDTVLGTFSGTKVEKTTVSEVGLGTISISGADLDVKISSNVGLGTISISGSGIENRLSSEIGSGTLSAVSGSAESKTISYNESSVATDNDYGSISALVTEFADYGNLGSILEASDFGLLPSSKTPFGLFTISIDKVEKKSYNYNQFSIVFYDGTEDYGSIGVSTSYEDNGSIVDFGPYDDFGTIAGLRNETVYPFGTINISGSVEETFLGSKIHEGSGTINVSGSGIENRRTSNVGLGTLSTLSGSAVAFGANPPEDTLLGTFSGVLREKKTASEVGLGTVTISGSVEETFLGSKIHEGSGTINVSGSGIENRRTSNVGLGTLSTLSGSAEVFVANPPEDTVLGTFSGVLVEKKVASEVGLGTISISGSVEETFLGSKIHEGSGTINASGLVDENRTFSYISSPYDDYGFLVNPTDYDESYGSIIDSTVYIDYGPLLGPYTNIDVSGSAITSENDIFDQNIGSGTVTISVDKIENRSYSYNEFSIVFYDGTEDYGFIGVSTSYEDNGSIIDFGPYDDFGTIVGLRNETVYPYGTISLSGSLTPNRPIYIPNYSGSVTVQISGIGKESFTPATAIGFGTIFTLSGSAVVFGANPAEDTVLGTFSGTKVEKTTVSEVGLGTINISGTSNIIGPSAGYNGSGTINVSGALTQSFTPATAIGSGTLSTLSGSAEVFVANPREDTLLGTFSGVLVERKTVSEVGLGTITISGASNIINGYSYIGTGTAFGLDGLSEAFGANPPEDIALLNISGSAIDVFNSVYTKEGSGSVDVSGLLIESVSRSYIGSGLLFNVTGYPEYIGKGDNLWTGSGTISIISGSAEVFGANPPEDTAFGSFSGAAQTKLNSLYVESNIGTIQISGSITPDVQIYVPTYSGSGQLSVFGGSAETYGPNPAEDTALFNISGTGRESFTPAREIGSGSISILSGSAEAYGANPPEDTALGIFSGTSENRFIAVYTQIGIGTINVSGSLTPNRQVYVPNYPGSGTIQISGVGKESFTPATAIGFGTIFTLVGSSESFGANPREDTLLGTFSGTKIEKRVYAFGGSGIISISGTSSNKKVFSYNGSGSFSALSGSVEATLVNPPEDTALISISGSASAPTTRVHVGSGSLSGLSGSAESIGFNPSEDKALFTISGSSVDRFISRFTQIGSGSIQISGSLRPNRQIYVPAYPGTGTISILSGSAEVFGANPKEDTALFNIFGTSRESFSPATYVSSGIATISGVGIAVTIPFVPGFVFVQII